MTPDHRRAPISCLALAISCLALAMAVAAAAPGAAETIAGTDLKAAELVAGLPWAFEVTVEPVDEGPVRTTRHRFKSTAPSSRASLIGVSILRRGAGRATLAHPQRWSHLPGQDSEARLKGC